MADQSGDKEKKSGANVGSPFGRLLPVSGESSSWKDYLISVGLVLMAALVGLPLRPYVSSTNLVMLFFAAVVAAAIWFGLYPAVVASLLSVILFDELFVPPYYTMQIDDAQYVLTFAGLLLVGLVVSLLAAQAREQMKAANEARLLEETRLLQTALLNSISHDLRTPLATITGALSSLLEDEYLLSPAAREDLLETAWEETIRLNRLVGNLLDMTRLQSGSMRLVCHTSDVEDLVGATLAQMPRRLVGRQVKSSIPLNLPPVEIDLALVVQALVNLLDNALKFAPAGRPIEIEAHAEGDWVVLAVKDRGPGLPDVDSEFLFDKFFRGSDQFTHTTGQATGTGLGLSIAKGIVEAHGGRIWAENRPGGGAVFYFTLPVALSA
ncbi:MAG: ATP-binding protein [Candidatus Promineifilaceae bacterium]